MKMSKNLSIGIDDNQNELMSAHSSKVRLYCMWKKPLETNDVYLERFKEYWSTADAAAGQNCLVPDIFKTSEKYKHMSDEAWIEATKAIYFFLYADHIRFGDKIREVSENIVLGTDQFPTTLDAVYCILSDTQSRLNQDCIRCRVNAND